MDDDAIDRARELLGGVGPITHRKMFGGAGLYVDGVIFAILIDDEILLKGDAALGAAMEAAGAARWTYDGKGKPVAMPYWRLPDSAYDDAEEACAWAAKALAAARAAPAKKPPVRKRAPKR